MACSDSDKSGVGGLLVVGSVGVLVGCAGFMSGSEQVGGVDGFISGDAFPADMTAADKLFSENMGSRSGFSVPPLEGVELN